MDRWDIASRTMSMHLGVPAGTCLGGRAKYPAVLRAGTGVGNYSPPTQIALLAAECLPCGCAFGPYSNPSNPCLFWSGRGCQSGADRQGYLGFLSSCDGFPKITSSALAIVHFLSQYPQDGTGIDHDQVFRSFKLARRQVTSWAATRRRTVRSLARKGLPDDN